MNCGRKALNGARVVLLAALLGLLTPASRAPAQSIVLGEIDYTTNGTPDEEARGVIHNLLIFSLSRLQFGKPKSLTDYIRDCRTSPQIKSNAGCDFPDIFIQLQFAERQNELQISGSVSRKTPSSKLETSDLDSIRVRLRDLTEGLSSVVRNISTILESK